jgi:predicted dehydrogenase
MKQVAIIGAGQLGRRHLQGLVKSSHPISVHIVDPFEVSRSAVQEFIATQEAGLLPSIQIHASIKELPPELDLVIVATTSSQRMEVIENLVSVSKVRHLVLEKFLFDNSEHYERAGSLIAARGITCWVNTPRRHFSIYRKIREDNREDRLLQVTVDGGDWGLCCNSVHFIDLVQFLSGNVDLLTMDTHLDEGGVVSKREGFVELTGELSGYVGSTQFCIRSIRNSIKPITVALHYQHQSVFVVEGSETLIRVGQGGVTTESFKLPYQSEMTGMIADQLFNSNICDLTPYLESVSAHLPLLHSFALRVGKVNGENFQCAIT